MYENIIPLTFNTLENAIPQATNDKTYDLCIAANDGITLLEHTAMLHKYKQITYIRKNNANMHILPDHDCNKPKQCKTNVPETISGRFKIMRNIKNHA